MPDLLAPMRSFSSHCLGFLKQSIACASGVLLVAGMLPTATAAPEKIEEIRISVTIQKRMDDQGNEMPITQEQVKKAMSTIRKRLRARGHWKTTLTKNNQDGFDVKFSTADSAEVIESLFQPGKLDLREVSPRNDEVGPDGKSLAQRVADDEELVPGYCAYIYKVEDAEGNEFTTPILLNRRPALGNSDIANAYPSPQQADGVAVTLNGGGTDKMIALTKNMRAGLDRIAIVLDGEIISAPVVNAVPLGKHFIIEGMQKPGEAKNLAIALKHPLENPLEAKILPATPTPERAK